MRKWYLWLAVLSFSFSTFAEDTINLTNGEWPPYLSEQLPENGFASAVVRESLNAVGMNVRYGYYPWKRAYLYAKNGADLDGTGLAWQCCLAEDKRKSPAFLLFRSDRHRGECFIFPKVESS